jgi:hypothetical protein
LVICEVWWASFYHGDAAAAAVSRLDRSRLRSGLTLRA